MGMQEKETYYQDGKEEKGWETVIRYYIKVGRGS